MLVYDEEYCREMQWTTWQQIIYLKELNPWCLSLPCMSSLQVFTNPLNKRSISYHFTSAEMPQCQDPIYKQKKQLKQIQSQQAKKSGF